MGERLAVIPDLPALAETPELKGLEMDTPIGPIVYRPIDGQSTMGAYVGQLAKKNGKGVMVNWHFSDGALFLPPFEEVRAMRKD